jgi:ribosomal protein S26
VRASEKKELNNGISPTTEKKEDEEKGTTTKEKARKETKKAEWDSVYDASASLRQVQKSPVHFRFDVTKPKRGYTCDTHTHILKTNSFAEQKEKTNIERIK